MPVLIIEDETLIAMELDRIMRSMGHTVVGVASREATAVEQAEQTSPGLVLCDIKLLDEDNGIAAAQRILQRFDVPVVFVTAFSEMLLTGGRLEPAFVVAKPFDEETLKVTVAQALSTYASPGTARDHKADLLVEARGDHVAGLLAVRMGTRAPAVSLQVHPRITARAQAWSEPTQRRRQRPDALDPVRRGRPPVQMPPGVTVTSDSGSLRRHRSPAARQISSVCP